MNRKIILISVFISFLAGSCFNRKDEATPKNIIPEKEFFSILTDIHLTNGLLSIPPLRSRLITSDTFNVYIDIIESHGYSKEAMDTAIQYYYIRKPKKLVKIYDQILAKFSEIESRVEKEISKAPYIFSNQWEGKSSYILPDPGGSEKPGFELTLIPPGNYSLNFSVTIYPDDQSFNPCFTAWLCNADSSETGEKSYLPVIRYIKDGRLHNYAVTGVLPVNINVVLKGWFYDYGNNPDYGEKNARIENISFYYSGTVR